MNEFPHFSGGHNPTPIPVWRGDGPVRKITHAPVDLSGVVVAGIDQQTTIFEHFLRDSWTDAMVILHEGKLVYEWYSSPEHEYRAHGLLSITKSIIGTVAGVLMEADLLNPEALATDYVPELAYGGYAKVTVRDLLDMRTGGDYREDGDPDGELARMEASRMRSEHAPYPNLYAMVAGCERVGLHEGPLSYRSLDTTALGWVLERAAGMSMTQMLTEKVLGPLGIEADGYFETDHEGHPAHAGGLALRPRDVARFGQMILDSGSVGDTSIVSPFFVKDLREGHPDESIDSEVLDEDGSYRNQFWVPKQGGRELLCLGIHGQMMVMDGNSGVVALKLSSWPHPRDTTLISHTYAAIHECARALN